jgi:DNA polymerase-3 subunit gamma/tau
MEISFHENLDKEFIKILSSKLYEWTGNRWIITLSKKKGKPSIKENEVNLKKDLLEKIKKRTIYKKILEIFPDAELIDVEIEEKSND